VSEQRDITQRTRNTEPLWKRDTILTASATLGPVDDMVLADATSGAITLTPGRASDMRGRSITVVKVDASANNVTFSPSGGDLVNGAASNALTTQYAKATYSAVLTAAPNTYGWIITRT
jgi:hypothetical protein